MAVIDRELAPYTITNVEGLDLSKNVGHGSYGVVVEVRVHGLPCVAKRLHGILVSEVSQADREAVAGRFRDECLLMSRLRHPNIVQFLGVHFGRDRYDLTLIMERMHTDLETALGKFPNIPLQYKIRILLDASHGLLYLHSQSPPIVHRDFTAANVLLSLDFRAKVADLGVSKILDVDFSQLPNQRQTRCPGAVAYMSPEALRLKPLYDTKLDVFSFGHVALYTANQTFPTVYELEGDAIVDAVKNGTLHLSKRQVAIDMMGEDHCLYQLVASCLQDCPDKRPTMAQVNSQLHELAVQHPTDSLPCFDVDEAAIKHEESAQELAQKVEELKIKLIHTEEEHRDILEPMEQVNTTLRASLQQALEEVQVKTTQLKQSEKQVESLKEQVARYEEQTIHMTQEMSRVHDKLVVTEDKKKKKKAKANLSVDKLKRSRSTEVLAVPSVPEEKYCRLEADYDIALQEIKALQCQLEDVKKADRDQQMVHIDEKPQARSQFLVGTVQGDLPVQYPNQPQQRQQQQQQQQQLFQQKLRSHGYYYTDSEDYTAGADELPPQYLSEAVRGVQPNSEMTFPAQLPQGGLPQGSKKPSRAKLPRSSGTANPSSEPMVKSILSEESSVNAPEQGPMLSLKQEPPGLPSPPLSQGIVQADLPVQYPNQPQQQQWQQQQRQQQQQQLFQWKSRSHAYDYIDIDVGELPLQYLSEPARGVQSHTETPIPSQFPQGGFPQGSEEPLRAKVPQSSGTANPLSEPILKSSLAEESSVSDSSFEFSSLPEPIVNYGGSQQPHQHSHSAQAQGYAQQPHYQQQSSGYEDNSLQSPQQMGIPLGPDSREDVVLWQSSRSSLSPHEQQQRSPLSPVPLPGHTSSPAQLSQQQVPATTPHSQEPLPPPAAETPYVLVQFSDTTAQETDVLSEGLDAEISHEAELVAQAVDDRGEVNYTGSGVL